MPDIQSPTTLATRHDICTTPPDSDASGPWPDPLNLPCLPQPTSAVGWLIRACTEGLQCFVSQVSPRRSSLNDIACQLINPLNAPRQAAALALLHELAPGHDAYDCSMATMLPPIKTALLRAETFRQQQRERADRWNHVLTHCDLPLLTDSDLIDQLNATCSIRKRDRRKVAVNDILEHPSAAALVQALKQADAPGLERRLNDSAFKQDYKDVTGLLTSLLARLRASAPTLAQTEETATPVWHFDPTDIAQSFLNQLPEGGDERTRRLALRRALSLSSVSDIGIIVAHANLQKQRLHTLGGQALKQRSVSLIPEVFMRMTAPMGDPGELRACDVLNQRHDGSGLNEEDRRAVPFRLTLVCGLYARLQRLHLHRLQKGLESNWLGQSQGLLHFNFLHTITGLGEIPELAIDLQNAFCECLLDAGKSIASDTRLDTVWAGSEKIRARVQERTRQLAHQPQFLGSALVTEDRFCKLIGNLSVSLVHAKLIRQDPLRRQMAAEVLVHFIEGLLKELAPFRPVAG